jgi:hypothetical protein
MTYLDRYAAAVSKRNARSQRLMMMRFGWRLLDGRYRRNTHLQHGLAAQLLSADRASVIFLSLSLPPSVPRA